MVPRSVISLNGEAGFPSRFAISNSETLSAVARRASGLVGHEFPAERTSTRIEIREQERRQIDTLAKRMQADLTAPTLQYAEKPKNSNLGDVPLLVWQRR